MLKQTDVYVFRVAAMLDDFAVHGAVLRRYSRSVSKLSAEQARVRRRVSGRGCGRMVARSRRSGRMGTVAGEFLAFTASRGGLAGLDGAVIGAFVATLAGYQAKTVEQKLCAVRSLLRFAAGDGLTDLGVLETVPAVRSTRQARIPSVWDPADVTKLLEAIDRGNPSGKRDYAIVLLICRLGLRGVDVKRLKFADLDWPGNRGLGGAGRRPASGCGCRCSKTSAGRSSTTSATAGRRATARRCFCGIPLRSARSPIRTICTRSWSSTPASRACALREKRRHGMHSLRHTLATRLMEDGTPVERIADILGHQSVESTGVYLKSSLGLLARCAWIRTGQRARGWPMSARSTLAGAIAGLIAEKRALGYEYVSEERVLARFDAFCASTFPGLGTVTRASVEAWVACARRRAARPATVNSLIVPVRELARWLQRRGVDAYVLPTGVLEKPARYIPHIYSDQELAALFAQTDRCHYCPEVPFRHLVMPVLFRTIYACGLRCSEARLLRVGDVDIDTGVLQIRDAKGGKDRQLPAQRATARTARRLPRQARRTARLGVVLPRRHAGRAVDARERQPQLPAVSVAGAHPARRPRTRPEGS